MPLQLFPHGEFGGYILSFYGVALVGLGLLTTTGYILAMDTFGPISDNAQGIFEMSGAGHDNAEGSKRVQRLDAAGNTTKALTKGFAIATAVVAAVALFHSYIEEAKLTGLGLPIDVPAIFLGMLVGGAAPFLFSAFSINAVGRAAFELINEVRSQFRNDPGIMAGTSKPNYASCVSIVTAAAQRELIGPGVLAIFLPLAVAFGFSIGAPQVKIGDSYYVLQGAQALGGFLAGTILSGQLLAVMLANAGGIWDNAKKVIEDGLHGGKGTEAHKAGIVCDTVGDPFKDTAGPALNPLIKVMNLVALLLAPAVITPYGDVVTISVTVACLVALAFSIWWSKRSSMTTAMAAAASEPKAHSLTEGAPKAKRITVDDESDKTH
jgi:K(+)-stimulated pyrophosphate-energized sodium pump